MTHKKLDVAVQMDPIARINIRGDSTFALLLEAQARGHSLSYYTPDHMALVDGEVFATVAPLTVRDVEGEHFTLGEERRSALAAFDVILSPTKIATLCILAMLGGVIPGVAGLGPVEGGLVAGLMARMQKTEEHT